MTVIIKKNIKLINNYNEIITLSFFLLKKEKKNSELLICLITHTIICRDKINHNGYNIPEFLGGGERERGHEAHFYNNAYDSCNYLLKFEYKCVTWFVKVKSE